MNDNQCPRCHTPNQCAIANGQPAQTCWCMQLPTHHAEKTSPTATSSLDPAACFCEKCLQEIRQSQGQQ